MEKPAENLERIVITPEMIEAGSAALVCLSFESWNGQEVAREVFDAMIEVAQISASTPQDR